MNNELFVYRHKTDKDVYLTRKYATIGGSAAEHFYDLTKDFRLAIKNTLADGSHGVFFEDHLNTPYRLGSDIDDTLPFEIEKDFEFDGYKGTATKTVRYHLKDFEKVVFKEVPSLNEWCTDCKEYDKDNHCCPRFNSVIGNTLNELEEYNNV